MLSRRFRQRRDDWVSHRQLQPMSAITCPLCQSTAEPAAQVGRVVICANPACASPALYLEADGSVRLATGAETVGLTDAQLHTLRKARGRTR